MSTDEAWLTSTAEGGRVATVVKRRTTTGTQLEIRSSTDGGASWSVVPLTVGWRWRLLGRLVSLEAVWPPLLIDHVQVHPSGGIDLEFRALVGTDHPDGEWPDGVWMARYDPKKRTWSLQRLTRGSRPRPRSAPYRM